MACGACGHDCCDGSCPPNQPLVYEFCELCGDKYDFEDLDRGICMDCRASGYTTETTECHLCGLCIGQKEFEAGMLPFHAYDEFGLVCCPSCAAARVLGEAK